MTTRAAQILDESSTAYQTDGSVYIPSMDSASTLEAGIYEIRENMNGIFFAKKVLKQDAVLKFKDSRLTGILDEAKQFWDISDEFKSLGILHKRGILLYGAPGVGKSILLSQVSEDATKKDAVVFYANNAQRAAAGLKSFREVEPERPTVVIFDDIDNMLGEAGFLRLLDGENKIDHVLFIATTNHIESFPPRLLRSGRFDTKLEILVPPEEARVAFFTTRVKGITDTDLKATVEATSGFTFAQLREVLASVFAYKRDLLQEVARIKRGDSLSAFSGRGTRPEELRA